MDFHILAMGTENPAPDPDAGSGPPRSITYGFGTGEAAMSSWSSPADHDLSGDGVADAVRLDFDGDGVVDDAMWDSDGDGRADLAVLDTDDDGTPDTFYSDTGRGLWDHRVTDPAASVGRPTAPTTVRPDTASGRVDQRPDDDHVIDVDGDHRAEIGLVFAGAGSSPARVLIDLDADGAFDAALIDDDADGCADVWSTRGQVRLDEGSVRD